jgi:hypothetical protein
MPIGRTTHPKAAGRRYTLELSRRQADLISQAAELCARFGTGHFYVLEKFFWSDLERARPHIQQLQLIKNGSLDVLPGIHEAEENFKVLYDLHQVIRHRIAHDREPGAKSRTVDHNAPLRSSKRESLARFEGRGRRYVLEVSTQQAEVISWTTELHARMGLGQFNVLDLFFWKPGGSIQEVHKHLDALRLLKNGSLNSDPGIASDAIDDDYRVLYDLHRLVRHRLAWDKDPDPPAFRGVCYDTPRRLSKKEALAKIVAVAARPQKMSRNRPDLRA